MKQIVFFDGDGTLWYPKSTKRKEKPHWIYHDPETMNDYRPHLILTPKVKSTLRELKKRGILTVVISTHPHKAKIANNLLQEKVNYFGLNDLFNEVHSARNVVTGKGDVICRVLKRLKIPKKSALMVGDSYRWDYLAAKNVGVNALLMDTGYLQSYKDIYPGACRVKRLIKNIDEIVKFLD